MSTSKKLSKVTSKKQQGFTLIEIIIVVAIIGIIAAIAYPSYQRYIVKTKRTDMMSEMHNIASEIESRKLARGSYDAIDISALTVDYPRQGEALYEVAITPTPLTPQWTITATPILGTQMVADGILTLNSQDNKCRGTTCGTGNAWNE